MTVRGDEHVQIKNFKGMNSTDPGSVIDDAEFQIIQNMVVNNAQDLERRPPMRVFWMDPADTLEDHDRQTHVLGGYYGRVIWTVNYGTLHMTRPITAVGGATSSVALPGAVSGGPSFIYNDIVYMPTDTDTVGPGFIKLTVSDWFANTPTLTPTNVTTAPFDVFNVTCAVMFKDRLFCISSEKPSRVYYSDIAAPMTIQASNFFDVTPGDGDGLVALIPFQEKLMIFKGNSIHFLYVTSDPATWTRRQFRSGIGCYSYNMVLEHEGVIYFVDKRGLHRTDGVVVDYIGHPIEGQTSGFLGSGLVSPHTTSPMRHEYLTKVDDYLMWTSGRPETVGNWFYNTRVGAWTKQIWFNDPEFGQFTDDFRLQGGIQVLLSSGARKTFFGGAFSQVWWLDMTDLVSTTNERYDDFYIYSTTPANRTYRRIEIELLSKEYDAKLPYRMKRHKRTTLEFEFAEPRIDGADLSGEEIAEFTTYNIVGKGDVSTADYVFTVDPDSFGTQAIMVPGSGYARRSARFLSTQTYKNFELIGLVITYFKKRTLSENPE